MTGKAIFLTTSVISYLVSNSGNFLIDASPGRRNYRLRTCGTERAEAFRVSERCPHKISLTFFQIVNDALEFLALVTAADDDLLARDFSKSV